MPAFSPRDIDFDLNLESEASTTLTLVGILVGVLVVSTSIAFYRHTISRFCRLALGLIRQDANQADMKGKKLEISVPIFPPEIMPAFNPLREERPSQVHRMPGFFSPIRKYPSTPRYSSVNVYRGVKGLHIPPPARLGPSPRPTMSNAYYSRPIVTPHIAGWMAVADSVVGAHPQARPLHTRVATKAEIEMISGHVHIPWAYKIDNRPPPIPVKVQKPNIVYPVIHAEPGMLRDVGNVRRRESDVTNGSMQGGGRPTKMKHTHRARGKENVPVSSLPSSSRGRF